MTIIFRLVKFQIWPLSEMVNLVYNFQLKPDKTIHSRKT